MTIDFDALLCERDRYEKLMLDVLEWRLHLKKKFSSVEMPLTEVQKKKNLFLYKVYERRYYDCDKLIMSEISNKST